MYIFGGKDDDNKLNDLWEFNLKTLKWTLIQAFDPPMARSGHSACLYKEMMIVFGGIFEVTKELDDLILFDFKKKLWITLLEENSSPMKQQ